ncbi:DUF6233 domain-containing protein [Streptomyces glebosus]|uniref:DUF6233 domain-containing protein n=1 Tax=Streptomyces glebosus TaxID=249580 RepID=UPI0035306520
MAKAAGCGAQSHRRVACGAAGAWVAVHHGQCTVGQPRVRPITRRAAIEALTACLEACTLCARTASFRSTGPVGCGMRATPGGLCG